MDVERFIRAPLAEEPMISTNSRYRTQIQYDEPPVPNYPYMLHSLQLKNP